MSQKILPLALCFAVGIALPVAGDLTGPSDSVTRGSAGRVEAASSRTWLVVHSRPKPNFSEAADANSDGRFVRLSAKFGADGTVSEIVPVASGLSAASVAEAVNAARRIKFTPATENGFPLSVLAEINYDVGGIYATGVRGDGRRFCLFSAVPLEPSVTIISVGGASDSEGWRVVYE